MAGRKAGSAVKHIILPGVIPRIRELFFSGFNLLAFYVATVYGMAKLIPRGHPFLNPDNIGKFGVIQAVAAAWKHLDFRWKNIDRILFFFALVSGLVLTMAYILGAIFVLVTAPAMASSIPAIGELFTNPNPDYDIAFMMMDRLLGIPGIYDSHIITDGTYGPVPNAFQTGLHTLFAYFSWGIFGFAVLMMLYFIVEIVLETTMTGTPFGRHFENVWIPIRIVAGLGLLIPIAYGLNSAQWITLYVAKMGSNFASNAWIAFNEGMENPLGMTNEELVALPTTPDFTGLAKDLFTIRACKDVDEKLALGRQAAAAPPPSSDPGEIVVIGKGKKIAIDAFFVDGGRYFTILGRKSQIGKSWPNDYASNFINLYLEGLRFYKGQDIKIVFGRFNEENLANKTFPGGVEPVCGEVTIPNMLPAGQKIPTGNVTNADISDGMLIGASHMFATLEMIIGISKTGFQDEGGPEAQYNLQLMRKATDRYYYQETSQGQAALQAYRDSMVDGDEGNPDCKNDSDNDGIDDDGGDPKFEELGPCTEPIAEQFFINLSEKYQRYFTYGPTMGFDYYTGNGQAALDKRCSLINCSTVVSGATSTCQRALDTCQKTASGYNEYKPLSSVYYEDLGQDNPFLINRTIDTDLFKYGWGGAGIWYKLIAEKNGQLTTSTHNLPRVSHFPRLMEDVAKERGSTDKSISGGGCERYNPASAGDKPISLYGNVEGSHELAKLYYNLCNQVQSNENMNPAGATTRKTGNPMIDVINTMFGAKSLYSFRENSAVNPMSALATLGRALLDRAIYSIALGAGGSAAGGIMGLFGNAIGANTAMGQIALGSSSIVIALSDMVVSFAFVGMVAGVMLYYILPFLPFMYFFFAVGTWVKSVFEALVGMPLWAFAHVRLDDTPGFPGNAASGGYFLLLEIFVRPILTLFSLLAAMFIFMSLASVLNMMWGIVTSNLVGFDPMAQMSNDPLTAAYYRPRIDQFFFTLCYIIFMYMMATNSFKLIDQVPDGIMRWIKEVKAFGALDSSEENVSQVTSIVSYPMYIQGAPIIQQGVGLMHKVPQGVGGIVGEFSAMAQKMAPQTPAANPAAGAKPSPGGAE